MEEKSAREYKRFLLEIKESVYKSQYTALKSVNKELINLYWDIGQKITKKQRLSNWGDSVVEQLAGDLQKSFPGVQGFSSQNLWRMKQFYILYAENLFLSPLVREIGWIHNLIIMAHCKDDKEKEFYISMTKKFGWTKNILIHQIEADAYQKYLHNQTNFDKSVPEKYRHQAKLAVRDEYTFGLQGLNEEYSENELEAALVKNIRNFLVKMGGYFAFIGNQFRIELEGDEYFVDLLLYHRVLKCLVAIELKVGDFKPEYAGKMQFYLAVLNDKLRLADENPSIGIILCKNKKRTTVEYALKDSNQPIGVSTYTLSKKLPKAMMKYMPTSKQISESLNGFKK
ncbi:MAG: hypothetical protein A2044_01680 [Candidatus Firestonebacteria bacterium GWA2_43_8]|nr:MAG: hypothetical protein A2044_01680 [Candidatus Firestonebacteria bacterium GWA2_43_8]